MFSIKFIKNNRNLFYYGLVEAIAKGLNILIVILLASFSNLDVYAQIAILIASELIFIELILAGQHNTALLRDTSYLQRLTYWSTARHSLRPTQYPAA